MGAAKEKVSIFLLVTMEPIPSEKCLDLNWAKGEHYFF